MCIKMLALYPNSKEQENIDFRQIKFALHALIPHSIRPRYFTMFTSPYPHRIIQFIILTKLFFLIINRKGIYGQTNLLLAYLLLPEIYTSYFPLKSNPENTEHAMNNKILYKIYLLRKKVSAYDLDSWRRKIFSVK